MRDEDEPAVRALLREPMAGSIRVALQREPDLRVAAGIEGHRHVQLVARDGIDGHVIGTCSRSVRRLWVNGQQTRVGYLAQLRRSGTRGGRHTLREAYKACEALRTADELPFDLTTIIADNHAARRLLERRFAGPADVHAVV